MGVAALAATGDELTYRDLIFYGKSRADRAALLDRVSFVREIDAFQPENKNLPLNETYLELAAQQSKKTLLTPCTGGTVSSRRQIRVAREKGYRVCLGPINNIKDAVFAVLSEPDAILLDSTLDADTLRTELLSTHPNVTNPTLPIDLSVPSDFKLNYARVARRTEGTHWRVLSFNILAGSWNHKPAISTRADGVAEIIRHLAPDFIGLQEVQKEWYFALKDRVAPYRFVTHPDGSVPEGEPSCHLLFNAEKFRQIASGVRAYTDRWLRCLHWSVLEDIKTGKRVILTNTHWNLTEKTRIVNAILMSVFIRELAAEYDAPVVCTGDFNTAVSRPDLQLFLTQSGFLDAVSTAPVTENRGISSWYWPVTSDTPYLGIPHIDHVIVSPGVRPLAAFLVLDPKILQVSDHLPLVVDLQL